LYAPKHWQPEYSGGRYGSKESREEAGEKSHEKEITLFHL
jgi:hypothetical protein